MVKSKPVEKPTEATEATETVEVVVTTDTKVKKKPSKGIKKKKELDAFIPKAKVFRTIKKAIQDEGKDTKYNIGSEFLSGMVVEATRFTTSRLNDLISIVNVRGKKTIRKTDFNIADQILRQHNKLIDTSSVVFRKEIK